MAILTHEELMNSLRARMGEDTSDESITFIENVQDTLADFETRLSGQTDWQRRYEENDRAWRQRYTDRFFKTESDDIPEDVLPSDVNKPKQLRFEDLFKEV